MNKSATVVAEALAGIASRLNSEKNALNYARDILSDAIALAECDAGAILVRNKDVLEIRAAIVKSQNLEFFQPRFEPLVYSVIHIDSEHPYFAADAVKSGQIVNKYRSSFDDSPEWKCFFDEAFFYKTQSILNLPIIIKGEVRGLLSLGNAMDSSGKTCEFDESNIKVMTALTSILAAWVLLRNRDEEVQNLLDSFVQLISTGIDARTPYNLGHSRHMVRYAEDFLYWRDKWHRPFFETEHLRDEFLMAVWLHDTGKLITPIEVMDKHTRLGDKFDRLMSKLDRVDLLNRLACAEKRMQRQTKDSWAEKIDALRNLAKDLNPGRPITEHDKMLLDSLKNLSFTDIDGRHKLLIEPDELECLTIERGTLTDSERKVMQDHVTLTKKLLSSINFTDNYSHVVEWASMHHEMLDGSGYPDGLKGAEIPAPVRLLSIIDIYDALTAFDRPYKRPLSRSKAMDIMQSMAKNGQLDQNLLNEFFLSGAGSEIDEK